MSDTEFIAFIDLLGISRLSTRSPEEYDNNLDFFRDTISDNSNILNKIGNIYFFSDCAYIQSSKFNALIEFIELIRFKLFTEGIYFKGALTSGSLNVRDVVNEKLINDKDIIEKRRKVVKGHYFGPDVIPLYHMHESLKGIGILLNVKDEMISREENTFNIRAISCYLPHMNNRNAETFIDLKFNSNDINSNIIDILFHDLIKSHTKSKPIGRYYIPPIITWIQSLNINSSPFSEIENIKDDNAPTIIKYLTTFEYEKHLREITGIEYIYFALLNKFYNECENKDLLFSFVKFITNRKRFRERLASIPISILSIHNHEQFAEDYSNKMFKKM